MKRLAGLFALFLLAACGGADNATFQGYVEGDFIAVAPEVGGRIVALNVERGSTIESGAELFRIEDAEATAAVAQADAELARAKAQLANLQEGQRPPEIAVIEAQIAETTAALDMARRDFERQQALFTRNVVSEAQLDRAREAITVAAARLKAVERQKDVAKLPARTPEIEAAERAVQAAEAAYAQARTRLNKHIVQAPADGRIEDVYYEAGEVAAAGAPIVSLLPEGRRKVIFFVPEPARPGVPAGTSVAVTCNGCPDGITAEIVFLATESEFTPPVIFSRETSDKLVFRAEARLPDNAALPLGQPVEVTRVAETAP